MPCKQWKKSIQGVDDIELGIPRASPLIYHCAAPESGKAAGLVFVIPNYDEDACGEQFVDLRRHLAEKYDLLAVTVEYHCYRSRLSDGAHFDISLEKMDSLRWLCAKNGVPLIRSQDVLEALARLPVSYEFMVKVTPPNGEYQNLGLMAALDHLAVLRDLYQERENPFDEGNIIGMGSIYGGYLAHLIAKIAPNTLRAVFDYSAMAVPPASYLFGGQAQGAAPYYYHIGKTRIFPLVATRWSNDSRTPEFYSTERSDIRNNALESHVQDMSQATARRCQYRIAYDAQGDSQFMGEKINQSKLLASAGFDVQIQGLEMASDDPERTGNAIRLQKMFDECYPYLPPNYGKPDFMRVTSIAYLCGNMIYAFEHGQWGCALNIEQMNTKRQNYYYY